VGGGIALAMGARGCDRVCSSLEGSLAFAGTGLMAAVAVSAALAVSAVKHRSAQYCAWIAAAQCCSCRYWTWRCRACRCSSRVIGVIYPGTNTLAAVAANRSCRRLFSTSRLVAVAAASSAAAMAVAVAACSAISRSCRRLISSSGLVMAVASSAAMSVTVCLSSHPLCVAMAAQSWQWRQPFQARRWRRVVQR